MDNGQKNAYVHGMLSSDIYHIGRRLLSIYQLGGSRKPKN